MLCGGLISLILHLKNDGDILRAIFSKIAEDKITLTTTRRIIVFLEISLWHHRAHHLIELCRAMNLKSLANHLCGKTSLIVAETQDFIFLILQTHLVLFTILLYLILVSLLQTLLAQLSLFLVKKHLRTQFLYLGFLFLYLLVSHVLLLQHGKLFLFLTL